MDIKIIKMAIIEYLKVCKVYLSLVFCKTMAYIKRGYICDNSDDKPKNKRKDFEEDLKQCDDIFTTSLEGFRVD